MGTPNYSAADAKSIVDNLISAVELKKLNPLASSSDMTGYDKQIQSINQLRNSFGDIATAKIIGTATENATNGAAAGSPRVRQLLQDLQGGTMSPERTALQTALAAKVKADPGFIDRLESQLASNPNLAAEIKDKMINKPAEAKAKLDDIFKPNADISAVLKAAPTAVPTTQPSQPVTSTANAGAADATFNDLKKVQGFSTFLDKAGDNAALNTLLGVDALQSSNAATRNAQLAKDNPVFEQLKQMAGQDPALFTKLTTMMGTEDGAAKVALALKDSTTDPTKTKDIVTNLIAGKTWDSPAPASTSTQPAAASPLESIIADIAAMKAMPGGEDFMKKLQANPALSEALGLSDILAGKVTDQNKLKTFAQQVSQIRKDAAADPNYFANLSAALDNAPPQMISQVATTIKEHPEKLAEELKKANRQVADQSNNPFAAISGFFDQLGMGGMMSRIMNVLGGLIEKIVGFFEKMIGGVSGGRMNGVSSDPNNPVIATVAPGTRLTADGRFTQTGATVTTQPGAAPRTERELTA